MNFQVLEFYLEFMNKGFTYVKTSNLDVSLNENDFSECLSFIDFVRVQFKALSHAMAISFGFS